ncbi:MAG: hypothetical protein KF729_12970 [Sandaracinaceae bacterium]|nr:hypothetical protein [Sandaracinaceae bacterium]
MRRRTGAALAACALALASGCGEDRHARDAAAGADGSGPADAAALDAALPDGGAHDGGAHDGGAHDASALEGDAGPLGCGEGPSGARGLPSTCERPACFDHAACVMHQLAAQGYGDYVECGAAQAFTPSSSSEACRAEPPFGHSHDWEKRCELLDYAGDLRFFCAPDGRRAVVRFSGALSRASPGPGFFMHLGHEFHTGSVGGSGDPWSLSWPTEDFGERFVGFQSLELPAMGRVRLQVWFFSGDLMSPMFLAGGFAVDLPAP